MGEMKHKKQWHMGFYGAMELEFRDNKGSLEFYREYQLSKKPLEMDMLLIQKNKDVPIYNDIGQIFRRHNIIEYKSPEDQLGIDQFYKGIAYVCLYKSLGKKANEIPADELTLSFIREAYPAKLIGMLIGMGYDVEEKRPGIYYVTGNLMFPVQIIVTGQMESHTHLSLKALSKQVKKEDAKAFVEMATGFTEPGDKENADAVLQISVGANQYVYDTIKEEDNMCEALRELMKDEIEAEVKNAVESGLAEGRAEGRAEERIQSIRSLMKNLKLSAEQAMESIDIPKSEYAKYLKML